MDIINDIEWYFSEPKDAKNKTTMENITEEELKTIVFDDSFNENVKFCFPLNNDFYFNEIRELSRPITVEQLLKFIQKFYDEPLKEENIDKAFENNEEWKEEILERFDDDVSKLTNYHVFEDTCTPDFCGIHFMEDSDENKGTYFIGIGPE
jgi:hypothetical protein